MRTTLTIDDDVAARLERLRGGDRSFKELVNDALRAGLDALAEERPRRRREYTVPADLGKPLVPIEDISEVLDLLDSEEWQKRHR